MGCGSSYPMLKDVDFVTKYFCLHKDEHIDFDGEIIDQSNYPLKEIIAKYSSTYFTNSVSYMIAYAIYEGASSIKLYGVDVDSESEYTSQRPSVTYWIGFARGLSIEVEIASNIDKPLFLYAFDDNTALITRMTDRMNMSHQMAQQCKDNGELDKAHQYLGQYADNKHWLSEIKG